MSFKDPKIAAAQLEAPLRLRRIVKALQASRGLKQFVFAGPGRVCVLGQLDRACPEANYQHFYGVVGIYNFMYRENDHFDGTEKGRLEHMIAWFRAVRAEQRRLDA